MCVAIVGGNVRPVTLNVAASIIISDVDMVRNDMYFSIIHISVVTLRMW
jgi:hypothetical protein